MRHSDLNAMGVEEMNVNEAKMINGGTPLLLWWYLNNSDDEIVAGYNQALTDFD